MSSSEVLSDSATAAPAVAGAPAGAPTGGGSSAPPPVQSSSVPDLATAPAVPADSPVEASLPLQPENTFLDTSNSLPQQVPSPSTSVKASIIATPSADNATATATATAIVTDSVTVSDTATSTVTENHQPQNSDTPNHSSVVTPMKSEATTVPIGGAEEQVVQANVVKGEPKPLIKCEELQQQQQPLPQPVVASSVEPLAPSPSSPHGTIPTISAPVSVTPTQVTPAVPTSTTSPTVEASVPPQLATIPQVKNEPANIVKTEDEQTNNSVEVSSKTASVDPKDPTLAIKSEVVSQNGTAPPTSLESVVTAAAPPPPLASGPTSAVIVSPTVAGASTTQASPSKSTPQHVPRQPMLSQPTAQHGVAVSAAVDPRSVAVAEQPPPPPAPPQNLGPPPRNLPKTCKHRPKNSRVFVGNLASEFTTPYEMVRIFYKYGELIEEPVLRRSFGFIQYAHPESATRAVAGEQGKIIGGIPIDLSIADNREVKKGTHIANNTPFPHGPKGKGGRPVPAGATLPNRKRRRSQSPPRRMGGVHPPQFRRSRPEPRNGVHMRILCMSGTARNYARQCEAMFRAETNLGSDVVQIVAAGLGDALGKCMALQIPYVLVVASKDVEDGTCTIRTLERTGYEKSGRGNGVITLREAIDVCRIDRGIPGGRNNPPGAGPSPSANNYGSHQVQMVPAGWSHQNNGTAPPHPQGQLPVRKPGWMSGPRAPPHPQQPAHVRGGAPPAPMHAQAHYGQQQMTGRGYDMQDYSQSGGPGMGWNQQPGAYPAAPPGNYAPQQPAMQQPGYGHGYAPPQPVMGGRGGGRDEYDPAAVMGNAARPQDASAPAPYGAGVGWQGYAQPPGGRGQARGNSVGAYPGAQPQYPYPAAASAQQYGAGRGASGAGNTYMGYDYSQQYGANSYQQQPAPPPPPNQAPPAPDTKNTPLVDVDKLTNLISAFHQQQQAVSAPQPPQNNNPRDRQPLITAPAMQQGARRTHQPPYQHQHPYQYPHQAPQAPQGQQSYYRR